LAAIKPVVERQLSRLMAGQQSAKKTALLKRRRNNALYPRNYPKIAINIIRRNLFGRLIVSMHNTRRFRGCHCSHFPSLRMESKLAGQFPRDQKRLSRRGVFVKDSTEPFAALDRSIADTAKRTQLESRIHRRVRSLMRENGLAYGYSEKEALEQATLEVTGAIST
jgi:hypothetical protein